MKQILRVFLAPSAYQAARKRYAGYRGQGACAVAAFLTTLLTILGWTFLTLESDSWKQIRQAHGYWFPHISSRSPRPADLLRYLTQGIWLLIVKNGPITAPGKNRFSGWSGRLPRYINGLQGFSRHIPRADTKTERDANAPRAAKGLRKLLFAVISLLCAALALLCITQPFDLLSQFIFMLLLWGIALLVRRIPGRMPTLMMIALSLTISCRYIWWRYTTTLNWDDPLSLLCGVLLLAAETYAWVVLVLGYFQTIWPLNRAPVSLPSESEKWPTVDLLVPTYNEPLEIVKPTVYAALGMDWPQDKLNIYILDDGGRPEFSAFAAQVGIHYIARTTHEHAKAGNINHALKQARGEFVAIFDCDHVPTRSFLQLTMGWFLKDKKLAMLQTPHHFFSPDPFERNLGRFRRTPNEGTLFYGLVQDGNDMWDAAFFCGSCAILRRKALDEIGGIATDTVTEDAHTSLRLHRLNYTSAYIRIPQAAGLATESLSAHIGQRIRWARGMAQIFRLDNPLLGKGLKLGQRLCYANAMLHFLSGIPRLIFLTAPLAFLLLHAYIIFAPAQAIALYVFPHMVHASLTNSRIQGRYRHSFWSEIYETVLAWYIARPTTVALFNPHKGKFNVTAKGGLIEEQHVDWIITQPYLLLVLLNIAGLIAGIWRLCYGAPEEMMTVIISLLWVVYNMTILGGAVAVAIETKQVRQSHRVAMAMPAAVLCADGHLFPCVMNDYSDGGVGIEMREPGRLREGDDISLLLHRGRQEFAFPFKIARILGNKIGLRMMGLTTRQHIDFIQCTFARADTWALWQDGVPEDRPIESLRDVLTLGFRGYLRMTDYAPPVIRSVFVAFTTLIAWALSFTPRYVGKQPDETPPDLYTPPARL
ncbi:UDP-forming cellulose synthase catalytic subunit [Brenneria izadpanahii]|uniref:Cellulose synthase catalytic subunit [UDP-forming] n=1 Tax=Brenneria izadpanahii TaxID=2722756 RepID=A0ABX7V0P5_9GAMM|nr:UDP-forming cellulose synthase catalytic subunit [Brenneria izadpanahii]QTF10457.1 UDP-forming cellulose synthase catalytic subunit [Brenneria izadpanahii]